MSLNIWGALVGVGFFLFVVFIEYIWFGKVSLKCQKIDGHALSPHEEYENEVDAAGLVFWLKIIFLTLTGFFVANFLFQLQ